MTNDVLKRPEPPKTPMIEKLKLIVLENLSLVTFVKWLDAKGRLQNPGQRSFEDIVAEYRGIDLKTVSKERDALIDYARAMQRYWLERDKRDAAAERGHQ